MKNAIVNPESLTESGAPDPKAHVANYMKTVEEWEAIAPTGGPGSSDPTKVQVVNLIGDPAKPGLYVQLLKVPPHQEIHASSSSPRCAKQLSSSTTSYVSTSTPRPASSERRRKVSPRDSSKP
jgi:hypothetical protein